MIKNDQLVAEIKSISTKRMQYNDSKILIFSELCCPSIKRYILPMQGKQPVQNSLTHTQGEAPLFVDYRYQ